jgi:energy-coupling factor transporter ATP-binding protein EcfA2
LRLLQLEIHEVRGIRAITLSLEGKSVVVLGPNGTGKSSIADALDFLLTGKIGRLAGEGTEGIVLREVGPHLQTPPEDAWVAATFLLPGGAGTVRLSRRFSHPSRLKVEGQSPAAVASVLALAERGQHMLTRRELLRYIVARAQTRAERVAALLNIQGVESSRQAAVKVSGSFDRTWRGSAASARAIEARLSITAGLATYSGAELLSESNRLLGTLGAGPLAGIDHATLSAALARLPPQPASSRITRPEVGRAITTLRDTQASERIRDLETSDASLRSTLGSIREDAENNWYSRTLGVVRESIPLVDDSGRCPVCDTRWEPADLRTHLAEKIAHAETSSTELRKIEQDSASIRSRLDSVIAIVSSLEAASRAAGVPDAAAGVSEWRSQIEALNQLMAAPLTLYPDPRFPPEGVAALLWSDQVERSLVVLAGRLTPLLPEVSPAQDARDQLTRIDTLLGQLESALQSEREYERAHELAVALSTEYEASRDAVLESVYDEVAEKFLEYYRGLHPSDSAGTTASLIPTGAGLSFEVGYEGLGPFPPHAVHSEGHQDSMGFCLYLALSERLTQGVLEMMILDDVLTSVDAEHRRAAAGLLSRLGQSKQFIVLTHDSVWARQLRTAGLVSEARVWRLNGWSLSGGPAIALRGDWWGDIPRFLDVGDVSSAASALRRNLEYILGESCEALGAKLAYRVEAGPDFGELYTALLERCNELLAKAKQQANSVNNRPRVAEIGARHALLKAASQEVAREQWVVNLNIHYNQFAAMSPGEVTPAVAAFEQILAQVSCTACNGLLTVLRQDNHDAVLKCPCGAVTWALPAA